jgi:hypothetical protein
VISYCTSVRCGQDIPRVHPRSKATGNHLVPESVLHGAFISIPQCYLMVWCLDTRTSLSFDIILNDSMERIWSASRVKLVQNLFSSCLNTLYIFITVSSGSWGLHVTSVQMEQSYWRLLPNRSLVYCISPLPPQHWKQNL